MLRITTTLGSGKTCCLLFEHCPTVECLAGMKQNSFTAEDPSGMKELNCVRPLEMQEFNFRRPFRNEGVLLDKAHRDKSSLTAEGYMFNYLTLCVSAVLTQSCIYYLYMFLFSQRENKINPALTRHCNLDVLKDLEYLIYSNTVYFMNKTHHLQALRRGCVVKI